MNKQRASSLVRAARALPVTNGDKVENFRVTTLPDYTGAAEMLLKDPADRMQAAGYYKNLHLSIDALRILLHIKFHVFGRDGSARRDRYSNGFNAYYGSKKPETAACEATHYVRTRWSIERRNSEMFEYDILETVFIGSSVDIVSLRKNYKELVWSKDRRYCQHLGFEFANIAPRVGGLWCPSARQKTGINLVCFDAHTLIPKKVFGRLTVRIAKNILGLKKTNWRVHPFK